ncbi:MAG: hypothetical protein K1060chlam1_00263 [Candidatus Anoxychlamydiales bacterium]|nr:hypothetical protein [Candidatus Anoxychlamydiales bacterium]
MTWYKEGLYFKCLKNCANCCSGAPGYVWLEDIDIEKVSKFLKISKKDFLKKYTRSIKEKISLIENFKNYDCCFLKDKKCQIYDVRPGQCKTFPFWKSILKSPNSWEGEKNHCPGIDDKTGKLYSSEEINKKI